MRPALPAHRLLGPLRLLRRRFLPAHVRADIRDHELLVAVLEQELGPDSDCLDVGAHRGAVLEHMVRLAPRGRHIAWEPLPALAEGLRAQFPSVRVRQAALSERTGERDFAHVLADPGWSGFAAPSPPSRGKAETIRVRTERLDDILPREVAPAFVKIDVEGAELEVLRGAAGTLRRHRPLVAFEHGAGSADRYGAAPADVHDLLGELGYSIFGLDGDGPYSRERFAELFASGERVNFLARPRRRYGANRLERP